MYLYTVRYHDNVINIKSFFEHRNVAIVENVIPSLLHTNDAPLI